MYIDIHTHLTHARFAEDWLEVLQRAEAAGLTHIVDNGLDPVSNRLVLERASKHASLRPALGIYPLHAVNALLPEDFTLEIPKFDVDQEIVFIEQEAAQGSIVAVGECGLDGYWLGEETFAEQERVFERLIDIALRYDLPLIIHTRKLEKRCAEILAHHKVERVNFHCYGGRVKSARAWAEKYGWWFSIPPNVTTSEAFQRMIDLLPAERLLTETDAPYLAPVRGERNEPAYVLGTIKILAERRSWSVDQAKEQVWQNFCALMNLKPVA